jgi:hypothetical protein
MEVQIINRTIVIGRDEPVPLAGVKPLHPAALPQRVVSHRSLPREKFALWRRAGTVISMV